MGAPPPGWYSDPERPRQQRYWDGHAWTEHRAPKVPDRVPAKRSDAKVLVIFSTVLLCGVGGVAVSFVRSGTRTISMSSSESPTPTATTLPPPTTQPPSTTEAAPNPTMTGPASTRAARSHSSSSPPPTQPAVHRGTRHDSARTPGALNPQVTQASIGQTICVSGWTATIRPSSSYTSDLKTRQLASGYTVAGDTDPSHYEEDHLISLELGGNPDDERNLWPEPWEKTGAPSGTGAETKDHEENALHRAVCSGAMTLAAAQAKIVADW